MSDADKWHPHVERRFVKQCILIQFQMINYMETSVLLNIFFEFILMGILSRPPLRIDWTNIQSDGKNLISGHLLNSFILVYENLQIKLTINIDGFISPV